MKNDKKFFLVQYPIYELDVMTLRDIYDDFTTSLKRYCDYGVVFIPNIFQMNELTSEQLTDVRDMINDILENKNDSDG